MNKNGSTEINNESVEQIKKQLSEMKKNVYAMEESIEHLNGTARETISNVINEARELVVGTKQVFD